MLHHPFANPNNRKRAFLAACVPLVVVAGAFVALGQQPPPPDMDALAREAEEFTRGRRMGAAFLWGALIFASLIIGWVRTKARRDARAAARQQKDAS